MSDSKTMYTTTVSKVKKVSELNKKLSGKLNGGQLRASKYKDNWQSVNINEVINKFAPGAISYENGGKIMFYNGGRYKIVADVAGGYLRIQDMNYKNTTYVTTNGKHSWDFKDKKEFEKNSHYRILKREEM